MDPMSILRHYVDSYLPTPPASTTATLSAAADSSDGEDHISRLPNELLSNVVSRLPVKDAARTTVLSSRWRGLWASTPLNLLDVHLVSSRDGAPVGPSAVTDAVSRILASHPGPFHSIHLTCNCMGINEDVLENWIQAIVAKEVQELVFANRPSPLGVALPASILRCSSLRRLYVGVWDFPDTSALPTGNGFPHLQELGICHTIMQDRDLDNMLTFSPALETLALVTSLGFPRSVPLDGRSIRCVVLWMYKVDDISLVDTRHLERLILWNTLHRLPGHSHGDFHTKVKIGYAPKLRVLGYLEPRVHVLEIDSTIIHAETKASPNATVPSVKILALKVQFGVRNEAKMLPSFLRCFPNVETLHVMSHEADEPNGKLNSKFWREVGPIECLQSHIKKVVFDKFRGDRSELAFLKFIMERAKVLQNMVIVVAYGSNVPMGKMYDKLKPVTSTKWASQGSALRVFSHEAGTTWNYAKASDISLDDPFDCLS